MASIRAADLSPADRARLRGLRRMKAVAAGALVAMALVFAIAFAFERDIPALSYVRAAAEGGMVGALADWFAVTALFRHPLGIPIPHTAIIPRRKDEIGRTLGEFVETEFLRADVVRDKLESTPIASRVGEWLVDPVNSRRVAAEAAAAAAGVLRALSDDDVRDVIESLAREHLIEPDWGPPLGERLERVVAADAHRPAVDLAVDTIGAWLHANRSAFSGLVSRRLPSWVPKIAHRLVDDTVYNEAVAFVDKVRADPDHPARHAIDGYLSRLADNLQNDPVTALEDERSALRRRATEALAQIGERLRTDAGLQRRVDTWVTDAVVFVVDRHRHDIASIITDTVERWDAEDTTRKIELMVGRDLQYIRLNGTVIGALAGVAIYTVAHAILG